MPDNGGRVGDCASTAELVRFENELRNVRIAGRRTTLRLEAPVWDALNEIASTEDRLVDDLVTDVERHRLPMIGLASAVRVFALGWFRYRASVMFAALSTPTRPSRDALDRPVDRRANRR